jgi:hypothetical protein
MFYHTALPLSVILSLLHTLWIMTDPRHPPTSVSLSIHVQNGFKTSQARRLHKYGTGNDVRMTGCEGMSCLLRSFCIFINIASASQAALTLKSTDCNRNLANLL